VRIRFENIWYSRILLGDLTAITGFVWIREQRISFSFYNMDKLLFITEAESVYSAVRTESLYKTDTFSL